MSADNIIKFVNYSIKNKGVDLMKESSRFFDNLDESHEDVNLVVPELLELIPSKRALVQKIVKAKINYNIEPNADHFKLSLTIKDVGQVREPDATYNWQDS